MGALKFVALTIVTTIGAFGGVASLTRSAGLEAIAYGTYAALAVIVGAALLGSFLLGSHFKPEGR